VNKAKHATDKKVRLIVAPLLQLSTLPCIKQIISSIVGDTAAWHTLIIVSIPLRILFACTAHAGAPTHTTSALLYLQRNIRTYTHNTHACPYKHMRMHTHTCTFMHTHTCVPVQTHAHVHTRLHSCIHTRVCPYKHMRTHTHMCTFMHTHTCVPVQTHAHVFTR
jgi:hypothetical protein